MDTEEVLVTLVVGLLIIALVLYSQKSNEPSSSKLKPKAATTTASSSFRAIPDNFQSITEVVAGLRKAGLECSELIIGVDFTKSNEWTGQSSFGGRCLHDLDYSGQHANPYQAAIRIIGSTLEAFDEDGMIPTFGFGCSKSKDRSVFPFKPDGSCCAGFTDVLEEYNRIVPTIKLSGPTSFAPLIRRAIEIVRDETSFHILLILADGQVTSEKETVNAIVEASAYPLSIILVGVGDGPWDMMREFDDGLPERKFDNFQFVPYEEIRSGCSAEQFEARLSLACLMEIPEQYQELRRLGLLLEPSSVPQPRANNNTAAAPVERFPSPPAPPEDDVAQTKARNLAKQQAEIAKGRQRVIEADIASNVKPLGNDEPPDTFLCPITQEVMTEPVVSADGYTYEKSAIQNWFKKKSTSPMNNQQVGPELIPNHSLRSQIMEWKEQQKR